MHGPAWALPIGNFLLIKGTPCNIFVLCWNFIMWRECHKQHSPYCYVSAGFPRVEFGPSAVIVSPDFFCFDGLRGFAG